LRRESFFTCSRANRRRSDREAGGSDEGGFEELRESCESLRSNSSTRSRNARLSALNSATSASSSASREDSATPHNYAPNPKLPPTDPLNGYHEPASAANRAGLRHIAFTVDHVRGVVDRVREAGWGTVGEIVDYENVFLLCYLRGPEGLIVELAERLDGASR
jgi:hypothetical protein